jgi:DNA-binding NarL/FixJ family response regulator
MIKVAIVEDDARLRESLGVLINGTDELRCVGTYPNAETALREIPENWPDVLLSDIHLPRMSGIECVAKLKEIRPQLQVIMLTICGDDEQIFESLKAGASGYLIKKTSPAKILEAIQDVHAGGSPMTSSIARKVVKCFQLQKAPKPELDLTKRETEILALMAEGKQYKEIAEDLGISALTVRTHIQHIYEKLHVRSRTEAVVRFLRSESGR